MSVINNELTCLALTGCVPLNARRRSASYVAQGVQSDATQLNSTQLDVELSWVELCRYKRGLTEWVLSFGTALNFDSIWHCQAVYCSSLRRQTHGLTGRPVSLWSRNSVGSRWHRSKTKKEQQRQWWAKLKSLTKKISWFILSASHCHNNINDVQIAKTIRSYFGSSL